MTRYEMIMRTAEHIERHPEAYMFQQGQVIRDPARYRPYCHCPFPYIGKGWRDGSAYPHCMLARMGHMAGAMHGTGCDAIARLLLDLPEPAILYRFVERHVGPKVLAKNAAKGLREFAKHYKGIPGDVRAIFNLHRMREGETV